MKLGNIVDTVGDLSLIHPGDVIKCGDREAEVINVSGNTITISTPLLWWQIVYISVVLSVEVGAFVWLILKRTG